MKKHFTDQLGSDIIIEYPPKRIVSLVPSQTELLFDLGLRSEVVGITKFCIHPAELVAGKLKIGGTKKIKFDAIASLAPDLIIGNKEENSREDIEMLAAHFPVWMSDIYTLDDAARTISDIGQLIDRVPEADYLNHLIGAGFRDLQTLALQNSLTVRAAYLIWKDPFMVSGQDTFINDIMERNGFINVVKGSRYPVMELREIAALAPDVLFLSSEPYPFREKHVEEFRALLPGVNIFLVDGEMFSWYGSRLVKAVEYFFHFQKKFYGMGPGAVRLGVEN
jgi:ABC-type Fe3+-hydroxamate transport system substrate-binding protein